MANAKHSSAHVEHYTPAEIVEPARVALGGFDLDPASSQFANKLVRARRIFTRQHDGLTRQWQGRVFLNPPGGALEKPVRGTRSSGVLWYLKLLDEWRSGSCANAVFIAFSVELAQAVQLAKGYQPEDHPLRFPYCIPKRRVRFDVLADDLIAKAEAERRLALELMHGSIAERLRWRIEELEPFRGQRVSGDQPTHSNLVVCLTDEEDVASRFAAAFADVGHCGGGASQRGTLRYRRKPVTMGSVEV